MIQGKQMLPVHDCVFESVKRCIDVVVSVILLIVLLPVELLIALAIKIDSAGPVIFRQRAIGADGKSFELLKFRSMHACSPSDTQRDMTLLNRKSRQPTSYDKHGRAVFKSALRDPQRITRAGRLIRRVSADELPQLWCVLRGEMSLVGPRPALPGEAELYTAEQRQRFKVTPGLTGLYQITARNRVSVDDMVSIDLEYVRQRSLLLDLKIIMRTPFALFRGL